MATTRILVVDDEEDLCEILKFNLEIEGYEVDTAYSAEEALKKDLTVYNLLLLEDGQYPYHLPHGQRYGERYAHRVQSRGGRLYLQAFLHPPSDSAC